VNHLLRALDTFRVLGIEFASLSESLDTATPAGRIRLYRVGRGGRTGAQFNRGASTRGPQKCASEWQEVRPSLYCCGRRQNWPPSRTRALHTRNRQRVRVFPQPCPQNPRDFRARSRCKRSRLAVMAWVSRKQMLWKIWKISLLRKCFWWSGRKDPEARFPIRALGPLAHGLESPSFLLSTAVPLTACHLSGNECWSSIH